MTKKTILRKMGVLKEVKDYIRVLKNHNIKIEKVILFGSFVKNKNHKYSDIDLAIVSSQFKKDTIDSMMLLSRLTSGVSDRIEPIALTPEDMKSKYHPLIGEIKKYGQIVYQAI
jgi:predicted nucleotidyltransferase